MRLDRDALLDLDASLRRRWIVADGLGGWSSSTVVGCAAARWDGLLVAADPVTDRRRVLLSRFEETVVRGDAAFPLSIARYPGTFHPGGQQYLWSFDSEPAPRWTYRIGHAEVSRTVLRDRGDGAPTTVRWRVRGFEGSVVLRLRPFLPFRDADALTVENPAFDARAVTVPGGVAFRPYTALPRLVVTVTGPPWSFVPDGRWYRRVEFPDDLRRGEAGHEDQGSPGEFVVPLRDGDEVALALTVEAAAAAPAAASVRGTRARRALRRGRGLRASLERSAEAFLVRRGGRLSVVAGYPWFREWGRDTFISLPGLLLAGGRVEECGEALASAGAFLRDGRMPNRFDATPATSDWGAVDPALWYARAVALYEDARGSDRRLRRDLLPRLVEIADAHLAAAGDEVLLRAGSPSSPATWMDCVREGRAVTPRHGFAVEVNALWYSLLAHLARRTEDRRTARRFRTAAERVGAAFLERLWLPDEGRLADQFLDGAPDRSVRPNMVIAASFERSPLTKAQRASVVACARRELLTPRGLRTLSPRDPAYRGRHEGDAAARDLAYHQGTVWPWLVGAFAEASLRALGRGRAVVADLRDLVRGFEGPLAERCLGHVSEVFDGDPPHRPSGAWAQAWSTAELLRAAALLGMR